jgi:KaiC/GvpD/RAD55 family RecA-like ATPase
MRPPSNSSRLSTGSPGFDDFLFGGLTRSPFYQIEGDTGAENLALDAQFAFEGKHQDERCLYVTL